MYENNYYPYKQQTKLGKLILWSSVTVVMGLVQLPYKNIDGNPVPTVIFKDRPSMFHAFILSLNFAFFGSFMAISLQDMYPKLVKYFLSLAAASSTIGIAIFGWLIVPSVYKFEAISGCM